MDARLALPRERIELLMNVSPRASIATPRTVCAQLGRLLYDEPVLLTGMGAQPCTPWPPMEYMPCGQSPSAIAVEGSEPATSSRHDKIAWWIRFMASRIPGGLACSHDQRNCCAHVAP